MKFEKISISTIFLVWLAGFIIYEIRLFIAPIEITIGVFNPFSAWIARSLIPILLPLLHENKTMKILT